MNCPMCGMTDESEVLEDYGPTGETIFACEGCGTAWGIDEETQDSYLVGG